MPDFAQDRGLGDVSYREAVDTSLEEARGDLRHAVAVGVGLYDRDVTHVRGQGLLDAADIAVDGGQVDLDPSAGSGGAHVSARWRSPDQVAKSWATFRASGRASSRRKPG